MKKILCLALLVGFAYPQATGNDFIREFPHGLNLDECNNKQVMFRMSYLSRTQAHQNANSIIMERLYSYSIIDSVEYVAHSYLAGACYMDTDQVIRMVKKWCDDNPDKTHFYYDQIVDIVLRQLPIDDECISRFKL